MIEEIRKLESFKVTTYTVISVEDVIQILDRYESKSNAVDYLAEKFDISLQDASEITETVLQEHFANFSKQQIKPRFLCGVKVKL